VAAKYKSRSFKSQFDRDGLPALGRCGSLSMTAPQCRPELTGGMAGTGEKRRNMAAVTGFVVDLKGIWGQDTAVFSPSNPST
jgi:hypothetical protein